jgi:hypothetical protein
MNILLDARVEAVTAFRRVPPNEASLAPVRPTPTPAAAARKPGPSPTPGAPPIERAVVEVSVLSAPGAARRVLNQISAAPEQLYVIRTLHVLNENDKGPPREEAAAAPVETATPAPRGQQPAKPALNFIVGNEKVQTSARIEMLRFGF